LYRGSGGASDGSPADGGAVEGATPVPSADAAPDASTDAAAEAAAPDCPAAARDFIYVVDDSDVLYRFDPTQSPATIRPGLIGSSEEIGGCGTVAMLYRRAHVQKR
jgi:hypothetical protein